MCYCGIIFSQAAKTIGAKRLAKRVAINGDYTFLAGIPAGIAFFAASHVNNKNEKRKEEQKFLHEFIFLQSKYTNAFYRCKPH